MRRIDRSAAARVLVATAAVMLGGCATKSDIRDLQSEIRALAARQDSLVSQLRMETRSTQDTLREQSDQLFDFRGQVFQQLRQIAESLSRMEALVGENQRGIASVRDQLVNLRRPPAGAPGGGTTLTGEPQGTGTGGDPEAIYNAAMSQYQREQLATARTALQQFLDAFPNHRLAPDAHFYLADIMARNDRSEDALEAFLEIQELFPTAEKVPDALYRAALLQIELDRMDDAEATLERIVNTYGGTVVADVAREKLDEIR